MLDGEHLTTGFVAPALQLRAIKSVHTAAWALFAGCILALPVVSWRGDFALAATLIALVLIEVAILVANGMRCPLTDVAERFTSDRADNFDIYLPRWLARYNKTIFGWLFAAGLTWTLALWWAAY
jgi:hypothetical protein